MICEVKKCTLVQTLRLCTGRTTYRGSRGIALPFHDNGTRRGWSVSITPRPLFAPGKDPVPIVQEAGWAPGPVWTDAENLTPTGIRFPNRPALSQSLYRLRYPAHNDNSDISKIYPQDQTIYAVETQTLGKLHVNSLLISLHRTVCTHENVKSVNRPTAI